MFIMRTGAVGVLLGVLLAGGMQRPAVAVEPLVASPPQVAHRAPVNYALRYAAYLGGVNIGFAEVKLSVNASTYRISGTARTIGLWDRFQQWRARFGADGTLSTADPTPLRFSSTQTTQSKQREILVTGGVLHVTKNHKQRSPRPALPGMDMLTALFLLAPCRQHLQVHTGRDGYEFHLVEQVGALSCRYDVRSDEDRDYEMRIEYERNQQHHLPRRIDISGQLSGYLILEDLVVGKQPPLRE